jgi:methylenetetrahydrofolate dehydrogenase (NADP+)/methenyltetrahydrofolate cyclohydrolase
VIQAGQSARILDGRKLAAAMRVGTAAGVVRFVGEGHAAPGLSVILAGDDPASRTYVRSKEAACREAGIRAEIHRLPAATPEADLLALIGRLNDDDGVDGILVQMPLPPGVGARAAIEAVDPGKDVDGFHPVNVGRLWSGERGLVPCTPSGIITLLESEGIGIEGRRAVVIGRSGIVGRPMAALLMHRNATVTICHSRTRNLPAVASEADILVAALGRTGFVTGEFIKPGATVIDVGINHVTDESEAARLFDGDPARIEQVRHKGYTLAGDVHHAAALRRAGAFTPVPGGVGPLTVAALLGNTLTAAIRRRGHPS